MPANAACRWISPRWGSALREQADDLVRCAACDRVGTVHAPPGDDTSRDREDWPPVPCPFTAGCAGAVGPEPLN